MRVTAVIALVLAGCAVIASVARAQPIAGAAYVGTHAGGGPVTLTVAADGRRVVAYRVAEIPGDTCTFLAQGDLGVWEGAAIAGDTFTFEYRLYDAVVFNGGFPAAGTASGTIRLYNAEVPGVKPACDSGLVAWTATSTPATPGPPAPPPGGSAPPPVGGATTTFRSQLTLRRRGATRLAGRVISPSTACRADRRVLLVLGSRVVGSVRAKRDGSFAFKRKDGLRGRRVRARVAKRTTSGVVCAAAASKRVRA